MLQAGLDMVLESETILGDAIASVAPEITEMNATKPMAPSVVDLLFLKLPFPYPGHVIPFEVL